MKDSEFIELLNLYLDHEISEADAVRLEAEVQNNAARRRVYQQYCRMQKACKLLTSDFATETATLPERKVVAFNPAVAASHARPSGVYVAGGFAVAAACVALIFVGRSRQEAGALDTTTVTAAAPVAEVAAPKAAPRVREATASFVATNAPAPAYSRPAMLVSDTLLLSENGQSQAVVAATLPQPPDQLAWINAVQLAPLPQRVSADALRFDVRPASLRPDRTLGGRAPAEANVEMTAFRFVK